MIARFRSLAVAAVSAWIILGAFALCPESARAVGFQPVSPEELKMTSEPKAPGASAIILYRQVDRDDSSRNPREDNYVRIKILKEEGRSHANIEIPFSKLYEDIKNLKARTIRPDGSIINFEGKSYEKTIVQARGVEYLAKTFTLPDVQVGSIIEYYYTVDYTGQWIFDSRWILSNELFTKYARFSLRPYPRFALRWIWQGVAQGPSKDGFGGLVRMEVHDIPAFETEDFMPPKDELKARVDFIYTGFEALPMEPDKFWKQVGKELNSDVESFINKRKGMEEAVSQIVSPDDSPEQKAQKIYARVQQFRNTSYEIEKTEQEKKREKEKDLSNVDDVWKRGYGNGFQLTWLYLALARAAGLDAHGVRVSDRQNYFFNRTLMNRRKLDTNVVLLHFKDRDVYCDPGAAFTPFGLLPWYETGVPGLRLDKNGGEWVETTLPDSSVSQLMRKAELKLRAESGALEGHLTVTYTGLEASQRRVEQRNEDDTARKKFLEDEVRNSIPVGSEVELVNKPNWSSPTAPLVAEFDLKVPGWAETAGRRVLVSVGLFSALDKHVFDHAQRVHPIYFEYPSSKLDNVTIELPAGWRVSSLPPPTNEVQKIIGFASKAESNKGALHLSRSFTTDITFMDPKYYLSLQSFYRMVRTTDEQQIVLLPGSTTASN